VQFNPWQVVNPDQLLSAFFDQIGKVIQRPTGKKDKKAAEARGAKWKAYCVLDVGGSIANGSV